MVTKLSICRKFRDVSEQMADQNRVEANDQSANAGAIDSAAAGPTAKPAAQSESASATSSDAASGQGSAAQAPMVEVTKADTKADTADASTRGAGQVMVMPPARNGDWKSATAEEATASMHGAAKSRMFGKRRLTAMAAVFALAAVAGVVGGSLASAAFGHLLTGDSSEATINQHTQALEDSIRKLSAEVAALKSSSERAAKADVTQLSKVNDRIDKVEKAQAEPAAKLAKLSETVDKLRVAAATPAPAPAKEAKEASKEITGSIPTPVAAPNRAAVEVNRLPTVAGWRIRDIANGGALIEGRQGLFEVYAGDPLPGLGRVDAIRRQDGRWVVVTSKGLIVAR
jgi:hypothetical protein